jgi:predicted dienelactone hydrolase
MLARALIFSLVLLAASAVAIAAESAQPVGTATIETERNGRKITSELWFPAGAEARVEDFSPRPPLRAIAIARQAVPAAGLGKRPLIVVSHGNWGSRFSQGWLALALVRAGYVVLSTTHPGTAGDDQTAVGRYRLWDRSRDVTAAMDAVLADAIWAPLIDAGRIGFVGHSFGGWTGVSLAGGRYDPAQQRAFCQHMTPKDFYCDGTLKDDVKDVSAIDAGESFKDERIKAFYIMASGPGQGFLADSLRSITTPFSVDTALFDEVLERAANSTSLARQIPGAREVERQVGHFAFVPECRPLIGRLLASAICHDSEGVDRALAHQQIARDVLQFFRGVL